MFYLVDKIKLQIVQWRIALCVDLLLRCQIFTATHDYFYARYNISILLVLYDLGAETWQTETVIVRAGSLSI